jgi:hypothetical protein
MLNRKKMQNIYPLGSVFGGYPNQGGGGFPPNNYGGGGGGFPPNNYGGGGFPPNNYGGGGYQPNNYGGGGGGYPPNNYGGGVRIAKKPNDPRDYYVYDDFTPYSFEREYKPKMMSHNNDFYEIIDWSDGIERYQMYTNRWKIVQHMFGGGKVSLINIDNKTMIPSISEWKIRKHHNSHDKMIMEEILLEEELDGRKRKKKSKKKSKKNKRKSSKKKKSIKK